MIQAVIKSTGTFVDKPKISTILIQDESALAVRRRNDDTNQIEQFTVGELFDSFYKKSGYNDFGPDSKLFEDWFSQKYLKNKNNIISIEFFRVNS